MVNPKFMAMVTEQFARVSKSVTTAYKRVINCKAIKVMSNLMCRAIWRCGWVIEQRRKPESLGR
jgi:hypothetical protein